MSIARRTLKNTSAGAPTPAVEKVVFLKSKFATEDAAQKYLAANGYTDFAISEDGDTFVAKSTIERAEFSDVRKVDMEDGVAGYVGKMLILPEFQTDGSVTIPVTEAAASTQGAAINDGDKERNASDDTSTLGTTKSETGGEQVSRVKLDWYSMYFSGNQTVASVIEEGMEGDAQPPGAQDVITATVVAMSNVLGDKALDISAKSAALAAIGTEMGSIVAKLYELFATMVDVDEGTEAEKSAKSEGAKKFIEVFGNSIKAMAELAAKASEPPKVEATPAPVVKEATLQVPTSKDAAPDFAAILAAAIAPLTKSLDEIGAKVDNATKTATEAKELASTASKAAEAVAKRSQVSKSAGNVLDPPAADPEIARKEAAKQEEAKKKLGNFLGLC